MLLDVLLKAGSLLYSTSSLPPPPVFIGNFYLIFMAIGDLVVPGTLIEGRSLVFWAKDCNMILEAHALASEIVASFRCVQFDEILLRKLRGWVQAIQWQTTAFKIMNIILFLHYFFYTISKENNTLVEHVMGFRLSSIKLHFLTFSLCYQTIDRLFGNFFSITNIQRKTCTY